MVTNYLPDFRELTADDLGIGSIARAALTHTSSAPDAPRVDRNDPIVREIVRLSGLYSGVLLSGPPGTSKSYYAAAACEVLTERDPARSRYVQFHASYQYEDFIAGFVPTESGFRMRPGPLLELAITAESDRPNIYVLVIDEFSRTDAGRVFGEALTYIDRNKRDQTFSIASGRTILIPQNLVIIGTMNPMDKGVDEVDAAFERRFAKISMEPSSEILEEMLTSNDMDESLKQQVLRWFTRINGHARTTRSAALGHAYFVRCSDRSTLDDLWNYQLQYFVQRAFHRDERTRTSLEEAWHEMFQVTEGPEEQA